MSPMAPESSLPPCEPRSVGREELPTRGLAHPGPSGGDSLSPAAWGWGEILRHPLPGLAHSRATRFWVRFLLGVFRGRVLEVRGLSHLVDPPGPFILALNHSQRPEALLVPALVAFLRKGRLVRFMTDWLVLLYPVVAQVVLLHGPIIVTRKEARPRWLNRFRRRYESPVPPFDQAAAILAEGGCVGVFPEGTMNRDRRRLLRGYGGVAQLSLSTGVPVVPVGIRFPRGEGAGPIRDREPFVIEFGPPLMPPANAGRERPQVSEIRDWHAQVMQAISRLSGKQWAPENQRTRYVA